MYISKNRQKNRVGEAFRMLRALRVLDNLPKRESPILFVCSDVDYSIKTGKGLFAPVLDSYIATNYTALHAPYILRLPPATSISPTFNESFTINYIYIVYRVISCVARLALRKQLSLTPLYRKLLRYLGSSQVVGIGLPPELCEAAYEEGIMTVELVHAMGYTAVPYGWDNRVMRQIPDQIICFDENTYDCLQRSSCVKSVISLAEQTFLSLYKDDHNSILTTLPAELFSTKPRGTSTHKRVSVLVFLQWTYGGEFVDYAGIVPNGVIPDCLLELFSSTSNEVDWLLRLHPIHLKDSRYRYQLKKVMEVCREYSLATPIELAEIPLPLLIKSATCCITLSSFAAYDADFFSKRTYLMCPTLSAGQLNSSRFEDLVKRGTATKGRMDAEIIKAWIASASP